MDPACPWASGRTRYSRSRAVARGISHSGTRRAACRPIRRVGREAVIRSSWSGGAGDLEPGPIRCLHTGSSLFAIQPLRRRAFTSYLVVRREGHHEPVPVPRRRTDPGGTLAFGFHGTGGDERQFVPLLRRLLPGAGIIAPRGDVSEMGALRFFRRQGEGRYDMDDLRARTRAMAGFVAAQAREAGASRIVGLGYSNGANILASVVFEKPELFDEVVLLHPLIPWTPVPTAVRARVLITAGRRDPICPPEATRRLEDWFRARGPMSRRCGTRAATRSPRKKSPRPPDFSGRAATWTGEAHEP